MSRIFTTSFASVYPHYVAKVERKGRSKAELDEVIEWLTGFDDAALGRHLADGTTISAMALQGSDGGRARDGVRQLRTLIDRAASPDR